MSPVRHAVIYISPPRPRNMQNALVRRHHHNVVAGTVVNCFHILFILNGHFWHQFIHYLFSAPPELIEHHILFTREKVK